MHDVIIVGGGPAGMTAALYALRNGKSALVIEKTGFGGQITHSPKVENYPGTISISGNELAEQMLDQILNQGAEIEIETVTGVEDRGSHKVVRTEEGSAFEGRTVILATGVKHRMLGLEGEEDLVGEGISFCAVCDGDFYTGKTVAVAGGGNSALQEAILLADKCAEVIMLQDLPKFTGEQRLQDVLFAKPNVRSFTNQRLTKLLTEDGVFKGVIAENRVTGEAHLVLCDGLFVAIGLIPENEPFKELAELNSYGYFDTDEQCCTKTPGVFVAGDCRSKYVRQVTTAAADGAVAALAACRYINEH
ncbi:MAG: FAD-dependent oxidoreductase [Lachnospiraceae bacterium]|nr:FAD-dependent oxidoreductase [Lachnospiraceae bacterium]